MELWLRPGMTVLDIGAHHGFYTLLASRKVGPCGQVFAFEPSPRERKKLMAHLRLNRCRNVQVEDFALADKHEEQAVLFIVDGMDTGCNSLRAPKVNEPTHTLRVMTMRLDDYLSARNIGRVDFIKLDVEGAELAVLKGATGLLDRHPRPVILCEVQDIRTEPWGYRANEIMGLLIGLRYQWLIPLPDGSLRPFSGTQDLLSGNFVAIPNERLAEIQGR